MREKKPDPLDPRAIAADFFRRLGGMAGMEKWGKTHRTLAYQLIAKLMAQPQVVNNVNVANVAVDGEDARRKLETAFLRLIEARRNSVGDPAVYLNGERLREPQYVDGRLIEHQPASPDPSPSTVGTQSAADDTTPPPELTPVEMKAPSYPRPINTEPSTTELWYEWAATRRDPWKNYG